MNSDSGTSAELRARVVRDGRSKAALPCAREDHTAGARDVGVRTRRGGGGHLMLRAARGARRAFTSEANGGWSRDPPARPGPLPRPRPWATRPRLRLYRSRPPLLTLSGRGLRLAGVVAGKDYPHSPP